MRAQMDATQEGGYMAGKTLQASGIADTQAKHMVRLNFRIWSTEGSGGGGGGGGGHVHTSVQPTHILQPLKWTLNGVSHHVTILYP